MFRVTATAFKFVTENSSFLLAVTLKLPGSGTIKSQLGVGVFAIVGVAVMEAVAVTVGGKGVSVSVGVGVPPNRLVPEKATA